MSKFFQIFFILIPVTFLSSTSLFAGNKKAGQMLDKEYGYGGVKFDTPVSKLNYLPRCKNKASESDTVKCYESNSSSGKINYYFYKDRLKKIKIDCSGDIAEEIQLKVCNKYGLDIKKNVVNIDVRQLSCSAEGKKVEFYADVIFEFDIKHCTIMYEKKDI